MSSPLPRLAIVAGTVGLLVVATHVALAADCNDQNGCIGYSEGMRIFANDPPVRGVIEFNEKFIDLGTKTFNGIPCPDGVIRIGQNTNRAAERGATQDTGKKVGVTGGRPVVGCAPAWGGG
jgi:hypothetical protein